MASRSRKDSPPSVAEYAERYALELKARDRALTYDPSFTAPEVRAVDPETGGEKGRKPEEYALIPVGALADVARVYGYGAKKYAANNWRKGYPWSWSYSAAQRHLNAFWGGEELDPESGLPHLAHAAFHLFSLMTWSADSDSGKDDRS